MRVKDFHPDGGTYVDRRKIRPPKKLESAAELL
jgi:hypothetical protein